MALALLIAALVPSVSFASGCTAMWATFGTGPSYLGYFNNSAGTASKFTTLNFTLSANQANALSVDPATGTPYYFDRTSLQVRSIDLNNNTTATVGTIAPAAPGGNNNIILGGYVDASSNLIMMGNNGTNVFVVLLNKVGNTTAARWQTVTYAGGTNPTIGNSGDLFESGGQLYMMTNTNPTAAYPLALTIVNGSITSAIASASITFNVGSAINVGGGVTDPATGLSYFGGSAAGQSVYRFTPSAANSQVLVDASSNVLTDLAACLVTADLPTVSKSFTPAYRPVGGATTTVAISIENSNTLPVWLNSTFRDQLPTGMTVATPNQLNAGACAASTTVTNVITATAGQTTMTFAAGGRIPAGGCTITFSATAGAQATDYVNTIPVGTLSTTAGTNTVGATATYRVGTDFSMEKQVRAGTTNPLTKTTTVGVQQTMQYVLTISNSSVGGTGSVTFTDSLPVRITPLLAISALHSGGGSCSVSQTAATLTPARVFGTVTDALAGSTCTVTVTARASTTVATFTNTATLAVISTTSDVDSTDNSATATVTLTPAANITISKTNGLGGPVVAGQNVVYTVTIANLGPNAATPSFLTDPGGVPGLSCTSVTCSSATGTGAACPAGGSTTMAYLQGPGIQINTFNSANTLTFTVSCGVTATGLP